MAYSTNGENEKSELRSESQLACLNKKHYEKLYLWIFLSFIWQLVLAQNETFLKHGPYLMNPAPNKISILFQTQQRALSWIEVREENSENSKRYQSSKHGLKRSIQFI